MGLVRLLPRGSAKSQVAVDDLPVVDVPAAFDPAAMLSGDTVPVPVDNEMTSEPAAAPEPVEADQAGIASTPAARVATKVIALANQKGGVAKTTTTLNLGVSLHELGHKVLLIDLDPQGNLTMSQGMNPDVIDRSMFDVLVHRVPITEIIARAEIDIAVASIDLAGAELALSAQIGRERALDKALVEVRGHYDYILIDTPPSLGLLTINAFVAATGVIVPVQCEYLSLRGLVQLENTLAMVRENLNPHVSVEGIVPTMYDGRTLHAREAIEILEENFGELVFSTRIRKTVRYAEAPVKGSSVLKYDPTGAAADAYRALAREVLAKEAKRDGA
jgi:chromosome partitioning protein